MNKENLSRENDGLIHVIARRYMHFCEADRAVDIDDLIQAGHIGLWKAAETYDSNGGKSWAAWAAWYIRKEMRGALGLDSERRRAHWQDVSFETALPVGDEDLTVGDLIADESLPDADAGLCLEDMRRAVRAAVERLPDGRQKRALKRYRLQGDSLRDIAEDEGVGVAAIQRDIRRGMDRLYRDSQLRELAFVGMCYNHKGVRSFDADWTSATERAALWHMEMARARL